MTACSSKLQALLYKTEASWAEASTDMSSAIRIQTRDVIGLDGFDQSMVDPMRTTQLKNDHTAQIPGPQSASFTFSVYLCGHQSTTAGATAVTELGNLMAWAMGSVAVSAASGTTVNGAGSTASNFVTTASATFAAGSLFRLGAVGDAKGEGQWYVVNTHTLTDLLSKIAAPAAPASTNVVYSAETVSTAETTCTVTAKRFLIQTADTQWVAHGCFPTNVSFSGLNPGELPMMAVTVQASWFEPVSQTFPNATAATVNTTTPSPNAQGSVFFQTFGTVTRSTLSVRAVSVDVRIGVQPVMGLDTVNQYQRIVGASRTPDTVTISLTIDAGGVSASPTYWADFIANGAKHLMIGFSTAAGQAVAMYFPRCFYTGKRPTQIDGDGLNRLQLQLVAGSDETGATDLARSMMRVGLA